MPVPHTIVLETDDDGNLIATVEGIAGPACGDASKWLNDLGRVIEDRHTADYYADQSTGVALSLGGDW